MYKLRGTCPVYAKTLDDATVAQMHKVLDNPQVKRAALMPDAHLGYSMPIGGVCLTDSQVFPSYVGYDIGCGVSTLKTGFNPDDIDFVRENLYTIVKQVIPMGFSHHKVSRDLPIQLGALSQTGLEIFTEKNGLCQIGTLGGGNHFIELGYDDKNDVYITVHSGSRGVGHGIASYYMDMEKCGVEFEQGTQVYDDYMKDMQFCRAFASQNRVDLLEMTFNAIGDIIGHCESHYHINCDHNHAIETPEGILHRKGATVALEGVMGLIPANMRDGVYVVKGLGNEDSLNSCSHGAGRVSSRSQAKKTIDLNEVKNQMRGVVCHVGKDMLDESPDAYKGIEEVLEGQEDLCQVVNHIKPMINWKG